MITSIVTSLIQLLIANARCAGCEQQTLRARIVLVSQSDRDKAELLHTYLNDHLAGSLAALELIEYLTKKFPGTELESFFADLYKQIEADQQVLRGLLDAFEQSESTIRKAGAWIAEKFARPKFGIEKDDVSGVGLLEALEGLVLGITGKQLLWRALAAAAQIWPQLRGPNYAELERSAAEQRDRVEEKRIAAAREAFRVG